MNIAADSAAQQHDDDNESMDSTIAHSPLEHIRGHDARGHAVHVVVAMVYLFLLPLAQAPKDIAFGVLVVYSLVRLYKTWRCYPALLRQAWVLWALLAWLMVTLVSVSWSVDVVEGLTEVKAFRVIVTPLLLWPILDRGPRLIVALLAGIFVMNCLQLAQVVDVFGLELEGDDRARGGLHPIQTAAFCLAALTWYLSAAFALLRFPLNKKRLTLVVIGAAGALFGLTASGSRGVWIAAAIVLPMFWMYETMFHREHRKAGIMIGLAVVILATGVWIAGGDYVARRVNDARIEFADAISGEARQTSVGQRVNLWQAGFTMWQSRPILGIGAGAFRDHFIASPAYHNVATQHPHLAERLAQPHAHSVVLHTLATTGIVGFVAMMSTMILLAIRTARDPRDHMFAAASLWIVIGWFLGSQFDCFHLNGHLLGLLCLIVALTLPNRLAAASD
ncbi:MAG: O-antigen ligase family protein [Phycisphaerales bacterium]